MFLNDFCSFVLLLNYKGLFLKSRIPWAAYHAEKDRLPGLFCLVGWAGAWPHVGKIFYLGSSPQLKWRVMEGGLWKAHISARNFSFM